MLLIPCVRTRVHVLKCICMPTRVWVHALCASVYVCAFVHYVRTHALLLCARAPVRACVCVAEWPSGRVTVWPCDCVCIRVRMHDMCVSMCVCIHARVCGEENHSHPCSPLYYVGPKHSGLNKLTFCHLAIIMKTTFAVAARGRYQFPFCHIADFHAVALANVNP